MYLPVDLSHLKEHVPCREETQLLIYSTTKQGQQRELETPVVHQDHAATQDARRPDETSKQRTRRNNGTETEGEKKKKKHKHPHQTEEKSFKISKETLRIL